MKRGALAAGRTVVLVDIENLCGRDRCTARSVSAARKSLVNVLGLPDNTQYVVATSHSAGLLEAGLAWPGARFVWMAGHDGADLALADVALNEDVADRFERVVIASGDGVFAVAARYLQAQGVEVTVVSRPESLANALRKTVDDVRYLPRSAWGWAA